MSDNYWRTPLKWNRAAAAAGRVETVFPSLCDPFDNAAPDGQRARFAELILETPNLEWLLLTKRIGNALDMLIEMFPSAAPKNVRVGATIVNQDEANRDLRKLIPIAQKMDLKPFLSMEPLLGSVRLTQSDLFWADYIGWVIVGGESGPNARTMHPEWVASLHGQCERFVVPFMFKQWGEHSVHQVGTDDALSIDHPPGHVIYTKVGKKAAGRKLYGVEHNGFPRDGAKA